MARYCSTTCFSGMMQRSMSHLSVKTLCLIDRGILFYAVPWSLWRCIKELSEEAWSVWCREAHGSLPIWALIGGLWTLYVGFECPVKHCCLKHLASHTSDQRLLHFLGTIHDVEALGDSWSMSTVIQRLLASHWPHLSLVLEWFGGIMLHVTLQGNC